MSCISDLVTYGSYAFRTKTLDQLELRKMYPENAALCEAADRHVNLTVGQNLDAKIANLRKELARLEHSKLTLGPLLDMNINDLRNAMSY